MSNKSSDMAGISEKVVRLCQFVGTRLARNAPAPGESPEQPGASSREDQLRVALMQSVSSLAQTACLSYQTGEIFEGLWLTREVFDRAARLYSLLLGLRGGADDGPQEPGKSEVIEMPHSGSHQSLPKRVLSLENFLKGVVWQYEALNEALQWFSRSKRIGAETGDSPKTVAEAEAEGFRPGYWQRVGMMALVNALTIAVAIYDEIADHLDADKPDSVAIGGRVRKTPALDCRWVSELAGGRHFVSRN